MTSKYELSKHRYYELKHWCLQYPEWQKLYSEINGTGAGDTTSKEGIRLAELNSKMLIVERVCRMTDADIYEELLKTVAMGGKEIPSTSYIYKKFFWLLDKMKD